MTEIAEGVDYLHGQDIIHGDLKGANIVISCQGGRVRPLLCDFGLSKIVGLKGFTTVARGTVPWMAPELLGSKEAPCLLTWSSDIWAWGMTVYVGSNPSTSACHAEVLCLNRSFSRVTYHIMTLI